MCPESFLRAPAFAFVANLVVDLGECRTKSSDGGSGVSQLAFRVFPTLKIGECILLCEIACQ